MKVINNKFEKMGDELKSTIKANSKLQICASIFSMYGFNELKKELSKIDELQFIFTDPTFIEDLKDNKETKKFDINNAKASERSIAGSEFEVVLKNKLDGKAIAKECARWIEQKAKFKSSINNSVISSFTNVKNGDGDNTTYLGFRRFDGVGLGYQKGNDLFVPVQKLTDYESTSYYLESFDELWKSNEHFKDITNEVVEFIENLYKENSPEFIYYVTLYNIFTEFLEDISDDELANEKTGFKDSKIWNMLYDFQKDAVLGIINKLERHNGCILADSVGLGKTFTALAVMKYYQERNKSILVLCPKKLAENWNTFNSNYKDNILKEDRFNYDVLFHTDLSRRKGTSNGIDLSRVNWGNYDLVVIDESHNFRNNAARNDRETRYDRLMNEVMKAGVKTKVLMLSATPVNNKFTDLKNQLALAYEGETYKVDNKISSTKSIDTILKNAQSTFNDWSKLDPEIRTSEELLRRLNSNFDFFKLLDSVTIARSRKHIEKYYDMDSIGKFPTRLKPISVTKEITDLNEAMTIKQVSESLQRLNMCVYSPFDYILSNKIEIYEAMYDTKTKGGTLTLKQKDRESSLKILMRINLLKRLESSVASFLITLEKINEKINSILLSIERFETRRINSIIEDTDFDDYNSDVEYDDIDDNSIGDKVKIQLEDMNTLGWKEDLLHDKEILDELIRETQKIKPSNDLKLQELLNIISNKIENPINGDNKKIIIFSAFADTATYIYKNVAKYVYDKYNLYTAKIAGSGVNETNFDNCTKEFNDLLLNFSPKSKNRDTLDSNAKGEISILIATDCISEGQNLQDCDYLINYDIHWNPVRIIQRFGRIDRIGSPNDVIQLVNFWPNMSLDDYINLKSRVESRMVIMDFSATGGDNVLTNKSIDTQYRVDQLKRLQEEVVDLEEMNSGISITDLGLNEYRMDLVEYVKTHDLSDVPNGMHSVVKAKPEAGIDKGVIYVLKNINADINIDNMNQLHPFYLVYIKDDGTIISNHLEVKNTLDVLRKVSKGVNEPIKDAYNKFNEKTKDGKNMEAYSELLNAAIDSIINVKEETDIDSLFRPGGTTMLKNDIKGLEDFELITFMVVV